MLQVKSSETGCGSHPAAAGRVSSPTRTASDLASLRVVFHVFV